MMTSAEPARAVLTDATSNAVNANHSDPSFSLSSALPPLPPSASSSAVAPFVSPGKSRRAQWDKSRLSMTRPLFVGSDDENAEATNSAKEREAKPHHIKASQTLSSLSAVLSSPTKRPPPSFSEPIEAPHPFPAVVPTSIPAPSPSKTEAQSVLPSAIPVPVPSAAARLRRQSSSLNSTYTYTQPHTRSLSPCPSPAAATSSTPPLVPRVFRSRESISVAAIPFLSSSSSPSPSTSASNAAALLGAAAELVRNSKRAGSNKSESQHKRRKSEDKDSAEKVAAARAEEPTPPARRMSGRVSISPSTAMRSARQSMSVSSASAFVRANPHRAVKAAAPPSPSPASPAPSPTLASVAASSAAPSLPEEMVEARQEVERLKLQLQTSAVQLSEVTAQQSILRSALHQQTEAVELLRSVLSTERQRVREVEDESDARQRRVDDLEVQVTQLLAQVAALQGELKEGEAIRRRLHAFVEDAKGSIRVLVRVRPSLPHEAAASSGASEVFGYTSDGSVQMLEVRGKEERSVDGSCLTRKRQSFVFDHVLSPSTPQSTVFDSVQPLLTSVLDGFSVLVFAYGQTGSGKTFTMEGPDNSSPHTRRGGGEGGDRGPGHARAATTFTAATDAGYEQRGLIQRSVEELFTQAVARREKRGWAYTVAVSILEVYPRGDAECIRDLLALPDDLPHELKQTVRPASSLPTIGSTHHSRLDVMVTNLSAHVAASPLDVYPLLDRARQSRSVGATECNERSSRSHLIVRLTVAGVGGEGERSEGVLHLVDLAGSERVKVSKVEGVRLKESVGINRSLSSLADVVCAWSKDSSHVPYRNSKLTHLLQPYLGGDAKVMMVVCLAGQEEHLGETVCSLRFAQTVSGVLGKRKG